ncbi:hypothetical protein [Pseudoxanthomonas japonensis]|uniref:hypothetical protein n=1 Tax=Pseudoxanthomonas japonensis TaxID=69284 RepID=UPI000DB1E907|nr:hypothetical protein [Pseudoxanthomonas japonensis]PZQ26078.1 MAG: hypothetical protein DI562_15465 [Stenotrophomonas acidaminiphila]
MSHALRDPLFSPLARMGYLMAALALVAVGHIWVYWHPIEVVMDVAAPSTLLFLAFARHRHDIFVKLGLASLVLLVAAMLAAIVWMKIPA